jgi:glycosyltransferase involved in cell wall biosynthesis
MLVERLREAAVECHFLGATRAWQFPGAVRRLAGLLRRQGPALLQSFLFHADIVGRFAARRADVRRVCGGIRVAEPGRGWRRWLDLATSGRVDRYVCVSQAVADFSASIGRLPREKLVVIPNAVDVARFASAQPADLPALGVAKGRRAVACVGRLTAQKGLTWLLDAAPAWLARLPDCDLLLVGQGPQEQQLRRQCAALGIADRVHFAGWRADVPEILAASAALVLPSRWEGMPNAVLEAMAAGLPVVAADAEGVSELLGPNAGQQVVPYGDSAAFSERLSMFLADPAAAQVLGAANRQRTAEFDWPRAVAAYENLWAGLLAE